MSLESITAHLMCGFTKALTGARIQWEGCAPAATQRVYYANHGSHGDFALLWACLPPGLRARTRPVAGIDYWGKGALRRYISHKVIRAVLIDRDPATRVADPIEQMARALADGDSLIVFPEGTRNVTDASLLPFKSGIFHLARQCPDVEFVPVWIENSRRVMPKGSLLPVPLLCTLTVGAPLHIGSGEDKDAFVERTRNSLIALMPVEA
jgi:1-acyl-sn-glycerol-3-phosphate acyltransferase